MKILNLLKILILSFSFTTISLIGTPPPGVYTSGGSVEIPKISKVRSIKFADGSQQTTAFDSVGVQSLINTAKTNPSDSATNSEQGFMTPSDHTKLSSLWNNTSVKDIAFTNDSIDCSHSGGIYYNSYSNTSSITLKGKVLNRITGGFAVLKIIGDGSHTLTLGTNMIYADGTSPFVNTNLKVNLMVIVWFSNISKWVVYNTTLTY